MATAAAAVGKFLGGAFLEQFLGKLCDRLLSSELLDFFRGKEPIVDLLNELETTLFQVRQLLNDAEKKLIKDREVRKWLDDLKEAVYDADDLVYKIDTEALRNKMEGDSSSSFRTNVLKRLKLKPTSSTAFDRAIKPEIEEILGKLKVLLAPSNNLGLRIVQIKEQPKRVPAPLVEDSEVYGRDADKEAVIQLLLSDDASDEPLSVIPIVGMGGIGKTTLAQLVYDDAIVVTKFGCRAWVTDGEDEFDLLKAMKTIIKQVDKSEKCEEEEQHALQVKLQKAVKEKKFLIVLDDIWEKNSEKWNVLKSSLGSGLHGSKIVVTTRNEDVASDMQTWRIHHLGRISDDDGWRLFAKHASIDANHSDLQEIGRKIVDKCKGLPLAIKSLGHLLRPEKDKREWSKILNSETWELYERNKIGILPALWLSYYSLPSYLKPCFAYCALFPKDHEFDKEGLILLWMAEGFLHSKNGKKMEEVGEEYFQELISMSFLIYERTSYSTYMTFEGLSKAKGLRTILALPVLALPLEPPMSYNFNHIERLSFPVEHLFKLLQSPGACLRVLSFSQCLIVKLPDSIGDLKYLRYLDLSSTDIEEIPDTLCTLYNLETLLLNNCERLTRLPEDVGNLINLRHLISSGSFLEGTPLQIGKIKTLQRISAVVLGKNSGSHIKLLKQLRDLSGSLHIKGLENVADVKDVLEADLKNKKFLSELILEWGGSHVSDDSEKENAKEVLCALEPHASLEKLSIKYYKGNSFPNWVGHHSFSNIVCVVLHGCKNCCFLPPLGQLPSLKDLEIIGLGGVERITSEFYYGDGSPAQTKPFRSLERLQFTEMSKLQEGLFIEGEVRRWSFSLSYATYVGRLSETRSVLTRLSSFLGNNCNSGM